MPRRRIGNVLIRQRLGRIRREGRVAAFAADQFKCEGKLVVFFGISLGPVFTAIPLWFLLVVFARDLVLLVGFLMLRARYGPIRVRHRAHGRAASIAISLVLLWCTFGLPAQGLTPLLIVAAALAVGSAVIYSLDGDAQGRAIAAAG